MSNLSFVFNGSFFASPGRRVIWFWSLFRTMFLLASWLACWFSSFEIMVAFLLDCFSFLAIVIG